MDKVASIAARIAFTLNGKPVEVDIDDELMLLNLIRDRFDILSPKNGCQPMGQCGCCAVMVDGKVVLSCVVKAQSVTGKQVTTLEGIPEAERDLIARAIRSRSASGIPSRVVTC